MIGLKIIESRCPWCGNITEKGSHREPVTCDSCEGKIHDYISGLPKFIEFIRMTLLLLNTIFMVYHMNLETSLFIHIFLLTASIILFIGLFLIPWLFVLCRCDDKEYFMRRQYRATMTFDNEKISMFRKYCIMQDSYVLPVCFKDNEGKPLTNTVCIMIDNAEKSDRNSFECIISFLPYSPIKYTFSDMEQIDFDFYCFRKKLGSGVFYCQKI